MKTLFEANVIMAVAEIQPHRWVVLVRWASGSALMGLSLLVQDDGPACNRLVRALRDDRINKAVSAVRVGCDVNGALGGSGATALMWARSRAMGEALLAEGATPDRQDGSGQTAVAGAVARGDLDYLRLLIKADGETITFHLEAVRL